MLVEAVVVAMQSCPPALLQDGDEVGAARMLHQSHSEVSLLEDCLPQVGE